MRRILILIVSLVASATIAPVAGAGTEEIPEIVDPAGDANFLSRDDVDARPASIDSADLRAVWFETLYDKVKQRDSSGKVVRVVHVPTALRVWIKTTAPVSPPPGGPLQTEVQYDVVANELGSPAPTCVVLFRYVRQSEGLPQVMVFIGGVFCDSETVNHEQFLWEVDGPRLSMTFPFEAFPSDLRPLVAPGAQLTKLNARTWLSRVRGTPTNRVIDGTDFQGDFVVASDVPADVDCRQTPQHPECS